MASITNRPNGRRRIQFTDASGTRHTLRLGKVARRHAAAVKIKIEDLVASKITGHAPSDETSVWLAKLDDQLRDKLARVGLAVQHGNHTTLGRFVDGYIKSRSDVKPNTKLVYARARHYLVQFFGESKPLRDITKGDAKNWELHLQEKGHALNTVRKAVGVARQFFAAAIDLELIQTNPFAHLAATMQSNRTRDYFVTAAEAELVLDSCPDAEWRLLFALARYGGLRVPSEPLRLRWTDIDWLGGRMTISSPKTERYPGHENRLVPLFPELLPYLRESFELADEGSEYCITRYRRTAGCNLRTQLHRIIEQAGLQSWPKAFMNLRASRQTELADTFPAHVVSGWLGNSVQVANKHYLQITDEHFRIATQKPTLQPSVDGRNDRQLTAMPDPKTVVSGDSCGILRENVTPCETIPAVSNSPDGYRFQPDLGA